MDGNRGAKGSIKDRLISMLYRMRYKKKKLKEKDYTVSNKEKQFKYINNLTNFKEKEDINILDKIDQKRLDNVKYNVNFKVNKKGISNEFVLNLDSIEQKSSELEEKVNLKQEVKKTKDEIIILKEVDNFLKKSLQNINEIKEEIEFIKIESKDKNKQTDELEERYKKLKLKIDKLKLQYDTIKEKYDLSDLKIIESINLINSIGEYKDVAKLNEMEMLFNVCKNEISKITGITILNNKAKNVGADIEVTKEIHQEVKVRFNIDKQKINKLNNIENDLEEELKYQQDIIDEMYKKASYFEKKISKKIYYVGHRNILGSFLRIAGGILTLPISGKNLFGIALGNSMINKGLKELNKSLEKKEQIVINYKYEDISNQIKNVSDKL